MPQLITHQLRVGGVVKIITNDSDAILTALVHDMGNLAKFTNLDPYWTREQEKFWRKYGRDAHFATSTILLEAGLDKLHKYLQEEADLYKDILNLEDFSSVSKPALLTLYGDSRVAYEGVVTMSERIIDLETRYSDKRNDWIWAPKLEKFVQSITEINISTITESMVEPLFDELLGYEL